jgi:hypothetical protein
MVTGYWLLVSRRDLYLFSAKPLMMSKKWIVFVVIIGAIFILPIFIKSLRYDLINGAGHGLTNSASKEESVERGVYVCDLVPVSTLKYSKSQNLAIEIKEAWIEKRWHHTDGWYWSTKIDDSGYAVIINTTMNESNVRHIDPVNRFGNNMSFGCLLDGRCGGNLTELPNSDTIACELLFAPNYNYKDSKTKCIALIFVLAKK